jgi:hypothetical protein
MKMNFREQYKQDNEIIKPDASFIEGMLSELESAQCLQPVRPVRRFGLSRTVASVAAACIIIIGAAVVLNESYFQNELYFLGEMGEAENNVVYDVRDTESVEADNEHSINNNGGSMGMGDGAVENKEMNEDYEASEQYCEEGNDDDDDGYYNYHYTKPRKGITTTSPNGSDYNSSFFTIKPYSFIEEIIRYYKRMVGTKFEN